jgi:hypothetical protein
MARRIFINPFYDIRNIYSWFANQEIEIQGASFTILLCGQHNIY